MICPRNSATSKRPARIWKDRRDKAIEAFDLSLDAIRDRLCGFIDDVIPIARCADMEEILALYAEEGAARKEKIRAGARLKNHTMDEILVTLVQHAQRFRRVPGAKKKLTK